MRAASAEPLPLVVAEQFGTLAELHPGRIDLGLGRAPGTDQNTLRALRRDPRNAENFPSDVAELNGYLTDRSVIPGVRAVPGAGTNVPLYILGSSLFGAQLAAKLGLPYSFASHFAPAALEQAVSVYRENYQPSPEHPEPYVIAAVNVTAADTEDDALEQHKQVGRKRVREMASRGGRTFTDEELDLVIQSPGGQQILDMLRYGDGHGRAGAGVPRVVHPACPGRRADDFLNAPSGDQQRRGMEILSDAWGLSS